MQWQGREQRNQFLWSEKIPPEADFVLGSPKSMERTLELESEDLRCVIQYGTWNKAVNLLGLSLLCTRRMVILYPLPRIATESGKVQWRAGKATLESTVLPERGGSDKKEPAPLAVRRRGNHSGRGLRANLCWIPHPLCKITDSLLMRHGAGEGSGVSHPRSADLPKLREQAELRAKWKAGSNWGGGGD